MFKTVSYSKVRSELKTYLDYVSDNSEIVTITRKNGKNVVLIAESDFSSINETLYLLSSKNNRALLKAAMTDRGRKEMVLNSKKNVDNLFK